MHKLLSSLSALVEAAPPKLWRSGAGAGGVDSLGGGLFERLPMSDGRSKALLAQVRATLWHGSSRFYFFFFCALLVFTFLASEA